MHDSKAATHSKNWNGFLFLGIIILSVFIREPAYLLSPRIWAEEGSVFIQAHLDNGFFDSFFLPHMGYYSLLSNLSASASVELLGLKWAAYGTTLFSLTVMLLCIYAPVYLSSPLWVSNKVRTLLVALSLLLATPEIWLNTINLHFYLALYACYFLLSNPGESSRKVFSFSLALLFVASLTGATTVLLLPLFMVRYFQKKKKSIRHTCILAVLTFGFCVQVLMFFNSLDAIGSGRMSWANLSNLPMGLARVLFYYAHGASEIISTIIVLLSVVAGAYNFLKYSELRFLAILILYVAVLFTVFSLQMSGGGRYAFAPSVLTALFFINVWLRGNAVQKKIYAVFGILFIAYKIPFYFSTEHFYDLSWPSQAEAYETALNIQSDVIHVHPMWEGADFRITSRE